jgi:hypothetical protein
MGVLSTQLLIGCHGSHVVHESEARSELAQQAAQIEIGQTSRAAVRSALGAPPWSNEALGFDAWRIADRQWNVVAGIIGVNPAPVGIPFVFPTWKNNFAYVLVTYDERAIVSGLDVESGPKGYRTLIEADGLLIESEWDEAAAQVGLLGPRRDAYLERMRHTPDCLGLLGAEPGWGALRLSIDGRPVDVGDSTFSQNDIPTIPTSWLVLVRLTPGEHRVEARELGNDSIHTTSIRCASGEPVYLAARIETVIAEVAGMFGVRSQRVQSIGVTFEPSAIMPTGFATRPLMVYSTGRWLAR